MSIIYNYKIFVISELLPTKCNVAQYRMSSFTTPYSFKVNILFTLTQIRNHLDNSILLFKIYNTILETIIFYLVYISYFTGQS